MNKINYPASPLSLERIDQARRIYIDAYQFDLDADGRHLQPVPSLEPIVLSGSDVATFLGWVSAIWRDLFESDLQCLAQDADGRRLLTTSLPLVTFMHDLCTRSQADHEAPVTELLGRLRAGMRCWREMCADTVSISGYDTWAGPAVTAEG